MEHIPGDKLYIDFSGKKLHYIDRSTGELVSCEIFVACLPFSDYAFAIAVPSQQTPDFLYALKNRMLNMPAHSIHLRVDLDSPNIEKWQRALYVQHFCADNIIALCYEHAICCFSIPPINLYMGICFSCICRRISEGLWKVVCCRDWVEY